MSNVRSSNTLCVFLLLLASPLHAQIPPIDHANQGSSMRLRWNNVGAFGHIACPPFNPGNPGGCDAESVGLEYPAGSVREHLYGGGIWVGGMLDTATTGISLPLRLVSLTYEGWSGPYYEFYPGNTPADTIWRVGPGAPKPPGWDDYWGNDLPYRPFADDNQYCRYSDTSVRVSQHVPLRLKVIHSSHTWSDSYADGMHIVEYRIFNTGNKVVDSAYVGMFLESDMPSSPYYPSLCYGFIPGEDLAYCRGRGILDSFPTPFGVTFVHLPLPPDSIRWTFLYFPGPDTPPSDQSKYAALSSGVIMPYTWPPVMDRRFVLAAGPFAIHPANEPGTEPLCIAVAFVSAPTFSELPLRAQRARELYAQGAGVGPPGGVLASACRLMQNYPNPFNGETTIGYRIQEGGSGERVTLKVYDLLGREMATLVDGNQEPGEHTVTYDGAQLPSGVYYCRLQTGAHRETKAMVLLR